MPPELPLAEVMPPEPPAGGMTLRSNGGAAALVAVLVAIITLAPLAAPAPERSTEVAASPAAPALGTRSGANADGSTDVDVPVLSDEPLSDDNGSTGIMSDGTELDVVTDPEPVSAETTIQRQLADHGWIVTVDGRIGAQTRRAIAEFQHANGLPPTRKVDTETSVRLASPDAKGYRHYLSDPLPVQVPASPTAASPTAEPPTAAAARPAGDPMARIEQIADSVGFDWRSQGVTFIADCHPSPQRCATGSYYTGTREIFITASILADREVLRSVVLHELAHAWQFTVRGWPEAADDVSAWGRTGIDGLEAAADCLAAAWGASRTYHWSCPADARAHMLSLYQHS
jgi:peptidoglycan hydrolase-like protein with peptidoglycan-binding domain